MYYPYIGKFLSLKYFRQCLTMMEGKNFSQSNNKNDEPHVRWPLLCYLRPVGGLPVPRGALSFAIPARAIVEANKDVQQATRSVAGGTCKRDLEYVSDIGTMSLQERQPLLSLCRAKQCGAARCGPGLCGSSCLPPWLDPSHPSPVLHQASWV